MPAEARPYIADGAPRLYGGYAERVHGTRAPAKHGWTPFNA
jgi:hypothetical protein